MQKVKGYHLGLAGRRENNFEDNGH